MVAITFSLTDSVVDIAAHFVRYASITPRDAGLLQDMQDVLEKEHWQTWRCVFEDTTNLYARWGTGGPHICFAGHVDVVPPGDEEAWTTPPFEPVVRDGKLYGRGTADMKAPIAAFLKAWKTWVTQKLPGENFSGTVSLLLTSDEEGVGTHGIPKMIPWMQERGEKPDVILIGEPTGSQVGQVLQVGRRGSVVSHLTVLGKQGHIACPELADNPLPRLIKALAALTEKPLDGGTSQFPPSQVELTSVDTGNPVENLIPAQASARFGLRFNVQHTGQNLMEWVRHTCGHYAGVHRLDMRCSGEPFLTQDAGWIQCMEEAMKTVTGYHPRHTTQGGTTDGRFLHVLAPVLELGMPEDTIHQVNEHVVVEDLQRLTYIYGQVLRLFFLQASPGS